MDTTPRYAPSILMAPNGRMAPVEDCTLFPPGKHPDRCPIRPEFHALRCRTRLGTRWFGFLGGGINSELRMTVWGFPRADEIRSKWEVVPINLQLGSN